MKMNDTSFDCPKWNMVYRQPNEIEVSKYWAMHHFKLFQHENSSLYSPYFDKSIAEGHCRISVDRGVVDRDFRVYMMGAELTYSGNPLKTTGSIISLWLPREYQEEGEVRPVRVHFRQQKSNGCRGTYQDCSAYQTM